MNCRNIDLELIVYIIL